MPAARLFSAPLLAQDGSRRRAAPRVHRTIRETVRSVLGPAATVRLLGSRADDSAGGGGICLLVNSDTGIEQPALMAARIFALLQLALADQRFDVLIAAPNV